MTTKDSPLEELRAQALDCAKVLKQHSRVIGISEDQPFEFAIAMDDKTIILKMTWKNIRAVTEADLMQYFVEQMLLSPPEEKDAKA